MKRNEKRDLYSSEKPADRMTDPFRVVLHKGLHRGEWVTHLQNTRDQSFFWGHYHGDDYEAALKDFRERCVRYNVNSFVCDHCGSTEHTNENCRKAVA